MHSTLKTKLFSRQRIVAMFFIILFAAIFLLSPVLPVKEVSAQIDFQENLEPIQQTTGLADGDIRVIMARIIRVFLGFLGLIAISIVLYAGYLWMTAGGDASQIEKAKAWLINGFIGLAIILGSYLIVSFVLNKLLGAIFPSTEQTAPEYLVDIGGGGLGGGALGQVIADHWPPRNATDVARNTAIMVKFGREVDPYSLVTENDDYDCPEEVVCGDLNSENVKVYQAKYQTDNGKYPEEKDNLIKEGVAVVTADNKNFVFKPAEYLGSSQEDVMHGVYLTQNIKAKDSKKSIFTDSKTPDYAWLFTTGTFIDETPPQVKKVIPMPVEPGQKFARNYIIQMTFDEPVIPPFHQQAKGDATDENNEIVIKTADAYVSGNFYVGINGFRTVEFLTDSPCEGVDVNSCGEKVYCLPANASISTTIKAAEIDQAPQAKFPYNGIVDVAGNSLDGNANKTAEGPAGDNYAWIFDTSEEIDLVPPKIISVEPDVNGSNVVPNEPLEALMTKDISAATLYGNVLLKGDDWNKWFVAYLHDNDSKDIMIEHAVLDKAPETGDPIVYSVIVDSGLRDLLQNCFKPCAGPYCDSDDLNPSCCSPEDGTLPQPTKAPGCGF